MSYIQLSLFGKTLWERFQRTTGWILKPCWSLSQTPKFQCLLLESGQLPVWCEGDSLTSAGASWTPNIGEGPDFVNKDEECFSWQILEENAAEKYYLSPAQCTHILHQAQMAGVRPPEEIEYLLLKQGGQYPSCASFVDEKCDRQQKNQDAARFVHSFRNADATFPTLMAQDPTVFAFWYPENLAAGGIRYLTPNECEWLQGLPTDWTAQGVQGETISDNARYQAIGNAIAVPCAEYIMAGIQETLSK